MALILMIGAADTGRAPMAAALLRRLLEKRPHDWAVESCGVLGHDGAVAEVEARDTMVHMGLDIADHQARSLDEDLAARAALIITLDRGTALVVRARFPTAAPRTYSLGELAGRPRDIPDPFRMQIGAWMTYAREIESMLQVALPRIVELMPQTAADDGRRTEDEGLSPSGGAIKDEEPFVATAPEPAEQLGQQAAAKNTHNAARAALMMREVEAGRIKQLLYVMDSMPDVIDWAAARRNIEDALTPIAAGPHDPTDLIAAYAGLLRAALALLPASPTSGQIAALQRAAQRLAQPIGQAELNELSGQVAALPGMT